MLPPQRLLLLLVLCWVCISVCQGASFGRREGVATSLSTAACPPTQLCACLPTCNVRPWNNATSSASSFCFPTATNKPKLFRQLRGGLLMLGDSVTRNLFNFILCIADRVKSERECGDRQQKLKKRCSAVEGGTKLCFEYMEVGDVRIEVGRPYYYDCSVYLPVLFSISLRPASVLRTTKWWEML